MSDGKKKDGGLVIMTADEYKADLHGIAMEAAGEAKKVVADWVALAKNIADVYSSVLSGISTGLRSCVEELESAEADITPYNTVAREKLSAIKKYLNGIVKAAEVRIVKAAEVLALTQQFGEPE